MSRLIAIFSCLVFAGCTAEPGGTAKRSAPSPATPAPEAASQRVTRADKPPTGSASPVSAPKKLSPPVKTQAQVKSDAQPPIQEPPNGQAPQAPSSEATPEAMRRPPLGSATDSRADRAPAPPGLGVEMTDGAAGLKLIGLAVGVAVQDRNPVGVDTRFTTIPPRFHCHCVFDSRAPETTVIHTWRRAGRVVSRVELQVRKSPSYRTWSRQRIRPEWSDRWSCTVTTEGGALLGRAIFEVDAPSPSAGGASTQP